MEGTLSKFKKIMVSLSTDSVFSQSFRQSFFVLKSRLLLLFPRLYLYDLRCVSLSLVQYMDQFYILIVIYESNNVCIY